MSDIQIITVNQPDGKTQVLMLNLSAGHLPALLAATYQFVKADKELFSNLGQSAIGHAAEDMYNALLEAGVRA